MFLEERNDTNEYLKKRKAAPHESRFLAGGGKFRNE
jgi:hypothetical protein